MWTQKSRFGEFHTVDQSVETACGYHGTGGILTIPKSSWSGFLLSCRDSKQFQVTELSGFSAVPIGLSGFQTIPEDGIIWFHCRTTRKGVHGESAGTVCVESNRIVAGDEESEHPRFPWQKPWDFLARRHLHDLPSSFAWVGLPDKLPSVRCLWRESWLHTRKALAARHSDSQCFFFFGGQFCVEAKVAMNHRKI